MNDHTVHSVTLSGMTFPLIPERFLKRHPSTRHLLELFAFGHLPPHLQLISRPFAELADFLVDQLTDGPELTAGLRKVLEGKDCAVRQRVLDVRRAVSPLEQDTPLAETADHTAE